MLLLILLASFVPGAACGGEKEGREARMGESAVHTVEESGEEVRPPGRMEAFEGEDPIRAKERARSCLVRLDIQGEDAEYYGSGILWDFQDGRLILATAGHLLDQGEVLRIVFPGGETAEAEEWKRSRLYDVGFVEMGWETGLRNVKETGPSGGGDGERNGLDSPAGRGTEGDLAAGAEQPALVSLHQRIFDTLDGYSSFFLLASGETGAGDLAVDLILKEKELYREEFGSRVMLFSGTSHAGMSGGGVFDGYGHLVGMAVGGREEETAALSMETLNAAYMEVYARRVDTQEYIKNGI